MPSITCGKCKELHRSAAAVRACYAGATIAPCDWLVERFTPGEYVGDEGDWLEGVTLVEDCGAEAIYDDRGFTCDAGHSHVRAEIRNAEGWEYAEDADEASRLTKAGVEPRDLVTGGMFRA